MKNSISASVLAVLTAAGQRAQAAPVTSTLSAPFKLQAGSTISAISTAYFGTCHIGAAIESMCLYPSDTTFQLNSSISEPALPPDVSSEGKLIWTLPSQPDPYPQQMNFYSDNDYGLYYAVFGIGNLQEVAFDDSTGRMGIIGYSDGGPALEQDWYVCDFEFEGYTYPSLAWTTAASPPVSRNCSQVSVTKVSSTAG